MKTKKVLVPAGFWRIFLARMIDLFLLVILSIGTLFFFINSKSGLFIKSYYFYIWSIITIFYIALIMIALPLGFKGIGYSIMKIKVISLKNNFYKDFLKRELPYSIAWIFVVLLTMSVINHTLINQAAHLKGNVSVGGKIINSTHKAIHLDMWDKTRITFCGSISGLITFIQMWLAITIIPNKEKRGWLDRWAGTQVVKTNKTNLIKQENNESIIKPIKINKKTIEYK